MFECSKIGVYNITIKVRKLEIFTPKYMDFYGNNWYNVFIETFYFPPDTEEAVCYALLPKSSFRPDNLTKSWIYIGVLDDAAVLYEYGEKDGVIAMLTSC